MTSLKRHFTVIVDSKENGLYVSSTPSSAARKAVSKLCADNKNKKVEFSIRETTQNSNKKVYGPYIGYMQKLDKPVELEGRVIKYKPIAKLNKKSHKMKGGNETIIINGKGDDIYNAYYNLIVEQMNEYCQNTPYEYERQYTQHGVGNYTEAGEIQVNSDFKRTFNQNKRGIIYSLKKQFRLQEIMKLLNQKTSEMIEFKKAILKYINETFKDSLTKIEKRSCNDVFIYNFSKDNIYIDTSDLFNTINDAELIEIGFTPKTYIEWRREIIPVKDFINAGYTLDDLVDDGVETDKLVKSGLTYVELLNKLSLKNLKKLNFGLEAIIYYSKKQHSIEELINAGFDLLKTKKILYLFSSGKYTYGYIKKKINEIKENNKNPETLSLLNSIEDELNELKKNCPTKFYNFKLRTNPDCLYPDKLSTNTTQLKVI